VDSAPASRPTLENAAPTMRPTAEGYFANQIGPAIATDIDNSGVGDRPHAEFVAFQSGAHVGQISQ